MNILDSAIDYIVQNWKSIIFTIALSSIFYFLSSRGLKKLIASRQEERLKIAKESIIDVLENQIINNSDIDNDKIIHLLNATSRERGVNLIQEYTTLDILEDLELRFVKSKHLKNDQREEYIRKIEILLKKIEEGEAVILTPYDKVLANLEEAIENGDNKSIKLNINFLRSRFIFKTEKNAETEQMVKIIAGIVTALSLIMLFGIMGFIEIEYSMLFLLGLVAIVAIIYFKFKIS